MMWGISINNVSVTKKGGGGGQFRYQQSKPDSGFGPLGPKNTTPLNSMTGSNSANSDMIKQK